MTQLLYHLPEAEYVSPGHLACQGCGAALAMRLALKALDGKVILVIPAGCWSVIDGPYPSAALKVPLLHMSFVAAAAAATGVRAALEVQGDDETAVLAWAGDGGTFDIGIQALSGAAERNEDIIYACYDNEAYMNSGVQRSSATPIGAWTSTTPAGDLKAEPKKNLLEIVAAHRVPYAATATIGFPDDLVRKLRRARSFRGFKLIHLLCPCPPGWRSDPSHTVRLSRLAVECKVFPLFEVEGGEKYTISHVPTGRPVEEYLGLQDRFRYLTAEQRVQVQAGVDREWTRLLRRVEICSPPGD